VDHHLRRTKLIERLPDIGADALLVTGLTNVRYLTGFTGSAGQALVTAAETVFFTDGRYGEQSRHEVPDLERVIEVAGPWATLGDHLARLGVRRLGFEAHHLTVRAHERLAAAVGDGVETVPCDDEVERIRWS
jgi:Xaa-Pro aminopeptidase